MAISAKKFRDELKKNGIFYTDEKLAKETAERWCYGCTADR